MVDVAWQAQQTEKARRSLNDSLTGTRALKRRARELSEEVAVAQRVVPFTNQTFVELAMKNVLKDLAILETLLVDSGAEE